MINLFHPSVVGRLIPTDETRTEVIGDEPQTYPVHRIPLDLLKYNQTNGRIFLGISELQSELDLDNLPLNLYNDEIEKLIWQSNVEKNEETKENIRMHGQLKPGMVLDNGTIVDGNRRFTLLRILNREFPDDERFHFYKAAVIPLDDPAGLEAKKIKTLELSIQYGQEKQVDYDIVNFAFSVHKNLVNNSFTTKEMASILKKTESEIKTIVRTVELINEFLNYFGHKDAINVIDKLSLYFPMTALEGFLKQNKFVSGLSPLDIERRKNVFFDYLAGGKYELPQQELRDKLIGKIYKNREEFELFQEKYSEDYEEDVYNALHNLPAGKKFHDAILEFRNSETSKNMVADYKRTVERINMKAEIDAPIKTLKNVIYELSGIELEPYLESNSTQSKTKLIEIREQLVEADILIQDLLRQIDSE